MKRTLGFVFKGLVRDLLVVIKEASGGLRWDEGVRYSYHYYRRKQSNIAIKQTFPKVHGHERFPNPLVIRKVACAFQASIL